MTVFFDSLVLPIAWAGTRSRVALKVFDKFQMSILPLRINNRWTEVTPPSVFLHAVFAFSRFFLISCVRSSVLVCDSCRIVAIRCQAVDSGARKASTVWRQVATFWGTHSFSSFARLGLVGRLYRPNHQIPQFLQRTKPPNPADSLYLAIRQLRHPFDFQDYGRMGSKMPSI
jgi:hypothetical protein